MTIENLSEKVTRLEEESKELSNELNKNWQVTLPGYVETLKSYVSSLITNTETCIQHHGITLDSESEESKIKHSNLIEVLNTYESESLQSQDTRLTKLEDAKEVEEGILEYHDLGSRIKELSEPHRERGYATSVELIPKLGIDTKGNRSERTIYAKAISKLKKEGYFSKTTKTREGSQYFFPIKMTEAIKEEIRNDIKSNATNDELKEKFGITGHIIRVIKSQMTRKKKLEMTEKKE